MQKYGSVENIYAHLGDDPKLEKKFGPFRKEADLSRELVSLEKHVPIPMPALDDLALPPEEPPLEDYFEKMGFASLMKRLGGGRADPKAKKEEISKNKQQSMF